MSAILKTNVEVLDTPFVEQRKQAFAHLELEI
jgi:hypothetical protein